MYKASIELAKINKGMKLKFGLIISSETDQKNPMMKLINRFTLAGNEYLKINPKPFVSIDISGNNDKGDGWSLSQSVNLNKMSLFQFMGKLSWFIKQYKEQRNLYYFEDKVLTLNRDVMIKNKIGVDLYANNKRIHLEPCVVPDEDNKEIVYEGCIFCINTYDNYSYLTYTEMEYLLYELSQINMVQLATNLMILSDFHKKDDSKELIIKKEPVSEQSEEEMTNMPVKIEAPNEIPNI